MEADYFVGLAQQSLWVLALASAPILIPILVVGVLLGMVQAATSINEQTLSFVPKLIVTATQSTTDTFVAKNDGVTYMVTPTALSVTIGGNTLRTESWVDFHGAPAPAASGTTSSKPSTSSSATTSAATPTTSGTATPSTAATAAPSSTPGLSTPGLSTPAATTAPSSAVPLPPPLPAEAGGSTSSGR